MRDIDLIIFDFDGTLVDSRKDIIDAVNHSLSRAGLKERDGAYIISSVGKGIDALFNKILQGEAQEDIERALAVFMEYHKTNPVIASVAYPGVIEVLEHFKAKHMAIITNRRYELTVPILQKLGMLGYFKEIIGGGDPDCLKPSPYHLVKVAHKLGIKDKKRTMIVGDMDIDIYAGKNAGIVTCGVTYGIGKKEDIVKARPDFLITEIRELNNIIK